MQTGVRFLEIDANRAGQRLDNFLITQLKGVPKSRIYRIVRKGEVRLNGGRSAPSQRLEIGDVVRIPPIRVAAGRIPPARADFGWLEQRILFEDEDLIALDKPAGLAVHGGSGVALGLIEMLRQARPQNPGLELAHRLDRGTSGCLLVAKQRSALTRLHTMWRAGDIEKYYLAFVQGPWSGDTREVQAPLRKGRVGVGAHRVAVDDTGKTAHTRFSPKRRYAIGTLVEIALLTGRTHQARVHARTLGHAIAGDEKYGIRDFNQALRALGLKRMFLHAARLRLRHPRTNARLVVAAPLPTELADFLTRLKP